MRLISLLLCLSAFAQSASAVESLCDVVVRRHASSVCRTNIYENQECVGDGSTRVCAYVIIMDNGQERVECETCTDVYPLPQPRPPAVQDCWQFVNGIVYNTCDSPILISTDDGSYPLTGAENTVSFDLNADGMPERTTWTAPDSTVAFLARDRNGNGTIDDGSELFGNHTPGGGTAAANGFDALAILDANLDGRLNATDPGWSSLLLWTDRNHDARSDSSELQPISMSSITEISLDYRMIGRRDEHGNFFRYQGTVQLAHGVRPIYDVFFRVAPPATGNR